MLIALSSERPNMNNIVISAPFIFKNYFQARKKHIFFSPVYFVFFHKALNIKQVRIKRPKIFWFY